MKGNSMDEYSQAADQMKEMLITEYIRKHPGLKRSEVATKIVNGRVVIESVGNIIHNCASRIKKTILLTPQEQALLKEIAKSGDERYAECLDSVGTSKKYAEWLCESRYTAFGERDKIETLEFLSNREQMSGRRALDILAIKKKLIQLMKDKVQASKSLIQTLTMEYMQAVAGQLKVQGAIFNKEVDLGNSFTKHTEKFIESKIKEAKPLLDERSLVTIAKAYQIAAGQKVHPLEIPQKIQTKEFAAALTQVKKNLSTLREQVQSLQKILGFMETLLAELAKSKGEDLTKEPPKPADTESPSQRMVYVTRAR